MSRQRRAAPAGPRNRHAGPRRPWAGLRNRASAAWPAVTGTGAAASATLALLVLICTFVAVAVPRSSLGYRTAVLQRTFAAVPAAQKTVLADGDLPGFGAAPIGAGKLEKARVLFAAALRRDGLPLAGPAARWQWSGLVTGTSTLSGATASALRRMGPPVLELLYRSTLPSQSVLVAGSLPTKLEREARSATFQVAVTTATAARLGVHVGSRLRTAGQTLVVTGIIRPASPASAFWTVDPLVAAPRLTQLCTDCTPFLSTGAFVGRAEVPAVQAYLGTEALRALWSFPLDLQSVTADQAAGLQRDLQATSYLPVAGSIGTRLGIPTNQGAPFVASFSNGLTTILPPFVATDDAVQRALSLLFVSLAVIAAVVVLLGARLVTVHRDREFAMMRARGASLRQLALVALRGGAVVVLPAAAVAVAAAVTVTPGPASWLSWWLAGAIVAVALAGPPALAAWRHRARRGADRAGAAPQARRRVAVARRWVIDATLVCAAVGGLVILRQQGLPPPGSIDLFTAAAPVLVAIPAALLVMRGYPLVLRQLTRVTGRRSGVVMIVGLARGSAAAQAGVLPAFALVLAFAVAAFAGMARSAVAAANVAASWQTAGADATIIAPEVGLGITPAAQRAIADVPGVQRTAAVAVTTGTSGQGLNLPVAVVDPSSYAALTAATPLPPFPAAALARPAAPQARVPVLVSPAARDILRGRSSLYVAGRTMRVQVVGSPGSFVGVTSGGGFAVLPRWALGAQAPSATAMAVVGPHLNIAALIATVHRTVPGSQVTLRSQVLAGIAGAPLPHGGYVTFAQGAGAAAGLSLLVLALTLVLSARSREMTLARLATMGLGPAQSRRITVVETLPAIFAATVGGAACALALVPLVGPSVNLAAFTGTPVVVPLHANLTAIAAIAAGLVALGWATLAVQSRLARSHGTTEALRVGE
jgi:putative ABC transport system permease protein